MIDPRSTKAYKLEKENRELKKRIKEALDTLEELIAEFELYDYITDFDKKIILPLKILKGSDKE